MYIKEATIFKSYISEQNIQYSLQLTFFFDNKYTNIHTISLAKKITIHFRFLFIWFLHNWEHWLGKRFKMHCNGGGKKTPVITRGQADQILWCTHTHTQRTLAGDNPWKRQNVGAHRCQLLCRCSLFLLNKENEKQKFAGFLILRLQKHVIFPSGIYILIISGNVLYSKQSGCYKSHIHSSKWGGVVWMILW